MSSGTHHSSLMTRFLLICVGGAAGTGARYIVNLAGSFLLGLLMQLGSTTSLMSADVRLMLTTGVMGGFTTYSTFNYETTSYFRQGAWLMGSMNVAATLVGCLIAGLAGMTLARLLFGR